jgi:membrane-bound lytic murein transglycosylase B
MMPRCLVSVWSCRAQAVALLLGVLLASGNAVAAAKDAAAAIEPKPSGNGKGAPKAAVDAHAYTKRPDVRAFINEMVALGFDRHALTAWLTAARYQPGIIAAMQRPILEPPKWFEYAPRFLTPERIAGGIAYWHAHAEALARAEAQYGVPPEIVVAILGVETYYGRNTGSYRVIDALTTLAFDYPRRASYFQSELREFLLFARDEKISPLLPKGSFAGALGVPQFMPGSVRRYAVDFDSDGRIDLWRSDADTIGSVANYLARHDWVRGQPVLLPAVIATEQRDATLARLDGGITERRPLAAWASDGVTPPTPVEDLALEPVGVLMLEEQPTVEGVAASYPAPPSATFWIACPNFYVITRYNKSRLYAAAVWSLAAAIKAGY